jgi:hypothetical protein
MRGRRLAGVLVMTLAFVAACGGDGGGGGGGNTGGTGSNGTGENSDRSDDSTPDPKPDKVKACDVVTKADATAVLRGQVEHPGDTPKEKQQSGSATYCAWAEPGTPFVFDDVPAAVALVSTNAKLAGQLEAGKGGLETVDIAGLTGYLMPDVDSNIGYVAVVLDHKTVVQIGVARLKGDATANGRLAVELARTGLGRVR